MRIELTNGTSLFAAPQHILYILSVRKNDGLAENAKSSVHFDTSPNYFTSVEDAETLDRRRVVATRNALARGE